MKKIQKSSLLIGLLLITKVCFAQGYTINFKLDGLEEGATVSLIPFAPYELPAEAETVVENGKFTFKGEVSEPREYQLKIDGSWAYFRFMVENSDISIKGKATKNETPQGTFFQLSNIKVKGSESHEYLISQLAVKDELNEMYAAKNEKFADVMALVGEARQNKDSVLMDSVTSLPKYKELDEAEKAFFTAVESRYNAIFEANKETFWGPLMMLNLYSYFTSESRPIFEAMSEEAKHSYYGQMVYEQLYPVDKEGTAVPAFVTKDRDGKEFSLEDLLAGKKVLLIDFWASWCGPCVKEIPNLKREYAQYADQGFEVVSISIDQSEKAWLKALDKHQLPWPNFLDRDVSALYKVTAVPTAYLVNEEGILIGENLRGDDLSAKLKEIFGE